MSYVRVWVHAVWGTKNRNKILTREVRTTLFEHIRGNAKTKNIYIDTINGHLEHVHCLFGLNADLSVSKTLQLIKGESAFWLNRNNLIMPKMEWADEYFAVSVSESAVDKVREYIKNQDEHHKKTTFTEEYDTFIKNFKLSHG